MRNQETGEFELVVGNRQLLSGFFIVVLLFAVAFAMGYVVGENSRSAKAPADTTASVVPAPTQETRPQAAGGAAPPPTAPAPTAPTEAAKRPTDTQPQPTTQPAREAQQPAATAPVAVAAPEGPPGSYWQIIATANKESAQTLLQTLKDKGFPASLSPGPNNLTRVLVGPYTDTASMGRAKTDLESAGFSHLVRH